jgi:hypothetical protein
MALLSRRPQVVLQLAPLVSGDLRMYQIVPFEEELYVCCCQPLVGYWLEGRRQARLKLAVG